MTSLRRFGYVWCLALSFGVAYAAIMVREQLWTACEPIDRPSPVDGAFLLYVFLPGTIVLTLLASGLCYALVYRRGTPVAYSAPIAALVMGCLVAYAALALAYDPALVPKRLCPNGLPDWWPSWLPI